MAHQDCSRYLRHGSTNRPAHLLPPRPCLCRLRGITRHFQFTALKELPTAAAAGASAGRRSKAELKAAAAAGGAGPARQAAHLCLLPCHDASWRPHRLGCMLRVGLGSVCGQASKQTAGIMAGAGCGCKAATLDLPAHLSCPPACSCQALNAPHLLPAGTQAPPPAYWACRGPRHASPPP